MRFPIKHSEKGCTASNSDPSNSLTFKGYVLEKGFNRTILILALAIITLEFCVFKYYYPYAGFINGDSYAYMMSAFYNLRADVYPIGYPKFLRLFSVFSFNDTSLVLFQYLLVHLSTFFLLFTISYFYKLSKWAKICLWSLTSLNPVCLYLANYISSDSLFLGLSIIWFTHLVWIINKPSLPLIISHAIVLLIAFMVRYNALIYPLIAGMAFFLNRRSLFLKIFGLCLSILLVSLFIGFTSGQFKRISGIYQFSPFSGWQLANNALYAYKFIDSSKRVAVPAKFKSLDQDVRNYFDSTRDVKKYPAEMLVASTVYMWDDKSPLRIHMIRESKRDTTKGELTNWSKIAPLYKDYASTLIKLYPSTFTQYYLWPNFKKYYAPPVEFLDSYSTRVDTVPPFAKQWFWYPSTKLKIRVKDMNVNTFNYYPVISAVINVLFLTLSISYLFLGFAKNSASFFKLWMLGIIVWILNMGFSVFASPVALRFQLFPFILFLIFDLIILNEIIMQGRKKSNEASMLKYISDPVNLTTEETIL